MTTKVTAREVKILGKLSAQEREVVSDGAIGFLAVLQRNFNQRRLQLLDKRLVRQREIDAGKMPNFLHETKWIRDDPTWRGAVPAPGLVDRRVEITGPVDRKMVINALNSGATQFMADFEDSNAPSWENCVQGQVNVRDAVNGTISYTNAANGKQYRLNDQVATLLVRPRYNSIHHLLTGRV